jgi:hypothetical protein
VTDYMPGRNWMAPPIRNLVRWVEALIGLLGFVVAVWVGVLGLISRAAPRDTAQVQMAATSNWVTVAIFAIAVVALFLLVYSASRGRITLGFAIPAIQRGGFISIFIVFLLLFSSAVGGFMLAIYYQIPQNIVAIIAGGLLGGLAGAWAAALFNVSALWAGVGAFLGLSADTGIATAGGDLPKTVLGAISTFIINTAHALIDALQSTHLQPPDDKLIALFLWPMVACVLIALAIGISQKSGGNGAHAA